MKNYKTWNIFHATWKFSKFSSYLKFCFSLHFRHEAEEKPLNSPISTHSYEKWALKVAAWNAWRRFLINGKAMSCFEFIWSIVGWWRLCNMMNIFVRYFILSVKLMNKFGCCKSCCIKKWGKKICAHFLLSGIGYVRIFEDMCWIQNSTQGRSQKFFWEWSEFFLIKISFPRGLRIPWLRPGLKIP